MEKPPALEEIQAALAEMRQPLIRAQWKLEERYERMLNRYREGDPALPPDFAVHLQNLRNEMRDKQREIDTVPEVVYRTIIVCDPDTDEMVALALVSPQCEQIAPFQLRGWYVQTAPTSYRLQRSQVGDRSPRGLIVSTDGKAVLSKERRDAAKKAYNVLRTSVRERRQMERQERKTRYARFQQERKTREAIWQNMFVQEREERDERRAAEREKQMEERRALEAEKRAEAREFERLRLEKWERERQEIIQEAEQAAVESAKPTLVVESASQVSRYIHSLPGKLLVAFCIGSALGFLILRPYFSLFGMLTMGAVLLWSRRSMSRGALEIDASPLTEVEDSAKAEDPDSAQRSISVSAK